MRPLSSLGRVACRGLITSLPLIIGLALAVALGGHDDLASDWTAIDTHGQQASRAAASQVAALCADARCTRRGACGAPLPDCGHTAAAVGLRLGRGHGRHAADSSRSSHYAYRLRGWPGHVLVGDSPTVGNPVHLPERPLEQPQSQEQAGSGGGQSHSDRASQDSDEAATASGTAVRRMQASPSTNNTNTVPSASNGHGSGQSQPLPAVTVAYIAGGVVGGIFLLIFILWAVDACRRSRAAHKAAVEQEKDVNAARVAYALELELAELAKRECIRAEAGDAASAIIKELVIRAIMDSEQNKERRKAAMEEERARQAALLLEQQQQELLLQQQQAALDAASDLAPATSTSQEGNDQAMAPSQPYAPATGAAAILPALRISTPATVDPPAVTAAVVRPIRRLPVMVETPGVHLGTGHGSSAHSGSVSDQSAADETYMATESSVSSCSLEALYSGESADAAFETYQKVIAAHERAVKRAARRAAAEAAGLSPNAAAAAAVSEELGGPGATAGPIRPAGGSSTALGSAAMVALGSWRDMLTGWVAGGSFSHNQSHQVHGAEGTGHNDNRRNSKADQSAVVTETPRRLAPGSHGAPASPYPVSHPRGRGGSWTDLIMRSLGAGGSTRGMGTERMDRARHAYTGSAEHDEDAVGHGTTREATDSQAGFYTPAYASRAHTGASSTASPRLAITSATGVSRRGSAHAALTPGVSPARLLQHQQLRQAQAHNVWEGNEPAYLRRLRKD